MYLFKKKLKKGFTLVELVVVIAVVAILSAVSVGAYFGITDSANHSRSEQEARQAYTQLQTKTLAGLSLDDSDTSLQLSKDGLLISGIYDDDSVSEITNVIYNEGQASLADAVTSLDDVDETSASPRIYYFAVNSSGSALVKYLGYIPANLSKGYVKYINLSTGEIKSTLDTTLTYIEDNLSILNLVKNSVSMDNFENRGTGNTYTDLGESSNTTGSYLANSIPDNSYFQFNANSRPKSGLYTKSNNMGQLSYVRIEWNKENIKDNASAIIYSSANNYTSCNGAAIDEAESVVINYPSTYVKVNTLNTFNFRLTSKTGVAYIDRVTFYFDTTATVPTTLTLDKDELVFNNYGDEYIQKLNPVFNTSPKEVEWSVSPTGVVEVDAEGNVKPIADGEAVVRASVKDDPSVYAECSVRVFQIETYTLGLVTDLSSLSSNDQIVLVSQNRRAALGPVNDANFHAEVSLENNSYVTLTDYSLTFTNQTNIEILTLESIASDNSGDALTNSFALKKSNGKYLATFGSDSNNSTLREGNLYDAQNKIHDSAIYDLSIDRNSHVHFINHSKNERCISYNENSHRFGSYKYGSAVSENNNYNILVYKLNHTTDTSLKGFNITYNGASTLSVNDEVAFSYVPDSYYPSFAAFDETTIQYESSNPSVIDFTDSTRPNVAKALTSGSATVYAKHGEVTSNEIELTVESVDTRAGWHKVSNVSEDFDGKQFVITSLDNSAFAKVADIGNYIPSTLVVNNDVFANDGTLNSTLFSGDYEIFEFESSTNGYKIKTSLGKYIGLNSNENHAKYFDEENAPEWILSFNVEKSCVRLIPFAYADTRALQYNSSDNRFACYKYTEAEIAIYVNYGNKLTPSITNAVINGSDSFNKGDEFTLSIELYGLFINQIDMSTVTIFWSVEGTAASIVSGQGTLVCVFSAVELTDALTIKCTINDVLAEKTISIIDSSTLPDKLDVEFKNNVITGTSYTDFSVGAVDTDGYVSAKGNMAGSKSTIQLRTDNSNSGVCFSVNSSFKVVKISVSWHSDTTNGRKINIYARDDSPFADATDLYKSGITLAGTLEKGETELTLDSSMNNNYIGIRSSSKALYLNNITLHLEKR